MLPIFVLSILTDIMRYQPRNQVIISGSIHNPDIVSFRLRIQGKIYTFNQNIDPFNLYHYSIFGHHKTRYISFSEVESEPDHVVT